MGVDYHLIDIGQLLSADGSEALAVNNAGVVVGSCQPAPGAVAGFRYQFRGGVLELPDPFPPPRFFAMGINDATPEMIVGVTAGLNGENEPALWTNGEFSSLRAIVGNGEARDINDSGIVVGTKIGTTNSPTSTTAFVLDTNTGQMTTDLLLPNGTWSVGRAVNDQGWAVGYAEYPVPAGSHHAVRYANGVLTDLDPNGLLSIAHDIDHLGFAAGVARIAEMDQAVLFLPRGGIRPLSLLPGVTGSVAYGVTSTAQRTEPPYFPHVVGQMTMPSGDGQADLRAFLWFFDRLLNQEVCVDLSQAGVPPTGAASDYFFHTAWAVDDEATRIIGTATYTDPTTGSTSERAVMLTDPRVWPP
jgi:uncharacterized membrane protein